MVHKWQEHFGRKPPCQFGCKSLFGHADIGHKMGTMSPTIFLYTHEKNHSAPSEPRPPANPNVTYLSYAGLPGNVLN